MSTAKAPWLNNYGNIPHTLEYKDHSLSDAVRYIASEYPDYTSYVFMGKKTSYKEFISDVDICAKALKSIGIKEGDKVIGNLVHRVDRAAVNVDDYIIAVEFILMYHRFSTSLVRIKQNKRGCVNSLLVIAALVAAD